MSVYVHIREEGEGVTYVIVDDGEDDGRRGWHEGNIVCILSTCLSVTFIHTHFMFYIRTPIYICICSRRYIRGLNRKRTKGAI